MPLGGIRPTTLGKRCHTRNHDGHILSAIRRLEEWQVGMDANDSRSDMRLHHDSTCIRAAAEGLDDYARAGCDFAFGKDIRYLSGGKVA